MPEAANTSRSTGHRLKGRVGRVAAALTALCALCAGATFQTTPTAAAATYNPATDLYSMKAITALAGAPAWWNAGYTGAGVDVAVIDTGVAPVPGLDGTNKIINGPDLSFESQAPGLTYLDTNGHGTFMAGLIAGHDSTLTAPYANAPATAYRGIAPDARIVNMKVGVADGGVDVTQVIAAIDWVVQHKNDNGLNIRVINLSYGTNSTQAYAIDPLAFAVEQAWKRGIVVVAAGGNYGFQNLPGNAPPLSNPAFDRFVLATGSADTRGTATMADDTVPSFSPWSGAGGDRRVDMVTPGSHIQGLRVPNGFIDTTHPEGRIDSRYFRGSGTSQSAAILSGAAALVLQKYPNATPDRVKKLLTSTAQRINGNVGGYGAGELNLTKAAATALPTSTQTWPWSTGLGSIDASRGTDRLSVNGVTLSGAQDIFGAPFNSAVMAAAQALGIAWTGGTWNGRSWSGSAWSGRSWSGRSWSGNDWSGRSWSGGSWSTGSWSGGSWSGSTWSGRSWAGGSWT